MLVRVGVKCRSYLADSQPIKINDLVFLPAKVRILDQDNALGAMSGYVRVHRGLAVGLSALDMG